MLKILLVIAVSVIIVLLSGGYYVFMRACHRGREQQWEEPETLSDTQWAPLADRISEVIQYLKDHNTRDIHTKSNDGLKLRARWLPADGPIGSILLFHGYRSCPLADFSVIIPFYHSLGFNLLLADQRSHGKSEGKFITFGIREHEDVLRWISYHNETFGSLPLYIVGMSMGATTVLMAAGKELPENVHGVIADCGFTDPKQIIREVMRHVRVPAFPLLNVAGLYARLFGRFGLEEYSTIKAMKTCRIPVLMMHGTEDHFVPCEMSRLAYDACGSEKQLILVEGATHGTSYLTDRPRCQKAVKAFLLNHLKD